MPRSRHPCAGMTKAQRAAFEAVAVGLPPVATAATCAALIRAGLLVQRWDMVVGRDSFGAAIRVPTYSVPLAVHAAWRDWCAEVGDAR